MFIQPDPESANDVEANRSTLMLVRQELKSKAEKLSQEGKSAETLTEIGESVPHMVNQLLGGHSSNRSNY